METWGAISSRRNVREFEDRPFRTPDGRPFDEVVHRGRW